jgi:hypothetical protein
MTMPSAAEQYRGDRNDSRMTSAGSASPEGGAGSGPLGIFGSFDRLLLLTEATRDPWSCGAFFDAM